MAAVGEVVVPKVVVFVDMNTVDWEWTIERGWKDAGVADLP
jgi:hypothetical protein